MILQVEHIAKSFGRKEVLRDVSFSLERGMLCGIVGENGSGKSTLLKIIVGEWRAKNGKVKLEGQLGYCPQQALLFSQLSVEENFRYYAAAYQLDKKEWEARMAELLAHFNFAKYRHDKIAHLSGGTQQKLNLSIALLHRPDLLILDEPYNGFDWDTYLKFWDYTNLMREEGCAILIVTHLLSEKERFDHIYHLENGCLV